MTEKHTIKSNDSVIQTTENVFSEKKPYDSFDEESFSTDSYDEKLEWTEEEEAQVRMLILTFCLNIDRTNICK
jgi:hypothetical protein